MVCVPLIYFISSKQTFGKSRHFLLPGQCFNHCLNICHPVFVLVRIVELMQYRFVPSIEWNIDFILQTMAMLSGNSFPTHYLHYLIFTLCIVLIFWYLLNTYRLLTNCPPGNSNRLSFNKLGPTYAQKNISLRQEHHLLIDILESRKNEFLPQG